MCTAVSYSGFFGRNLDYEFSYGESVAVVPRRYRFLGSLPAKGFAMLGVAHLAGGRPLFYDAVNERGLAMAGLSFPDFARYPSGGGEYRVPSFDLIPWVLRQCRTAADAAELLRRTTVTDEAYSDELRPTPLHWMIADKREAYVVEPLGDSLRLSAAPAGVLTNSPPFDFQMLNLATYMGLSPKEGENRFAEGVSLQLYSRGLGAFGVPGDLSSASRFVRASFTRLCSESEAGSELAQIFHILGSVSQTRGCVRLPGGGLEKTIYTSVCDLENAVYYTTTYEDPGLSAVRLRDADPDARELTAYPLLHEMRINYPPKKAPDTFS